VKESMEMSLPRIFRERSDDKRGEGKAKGTFLG
jgi:hypothetical protein